MHAFCVAAAVRTTAAASTHGPQLVLHLMSLLATYDVLCGKAPLQTRTGFTFLVGIGASDCVRANRRADLQLSPQCPSCHGGGGGGGY